MEWLFALAAKVHAADDWLSNNWRVARTVCDDFRYDDDAIADVMGLLIDEIQRLNGTIRERDEAVELLRRACVVANPDQPSPDILTMIRSRIAARDGDAVSIDDILHGLKAESSADDEVKNGE